ncbi:MAG: hypothetical protein TREMPRED_002428 [Tremellales sp. Tagirdzhanova-0007]|nr:MAG: hypothetical protein TREMPRED_002428 [Tremellales sp. Tagirdzhanova-0007]
MAYAYPSDPTSSVSSLGSGHRYPHSSSHPRHYSQRPSDGLLRELKEKLEEDEDYINFFHERIRVEENYISGLTQLHSRAVAVDSLKEDVMRGEMKPTSRRAWTEVRDYTQREIQSREAMVGALKEDVVNEMVKLRDEQMRIKQGLKDNIKLSNEMYDEHSKTQLPRLKRSYWAKCQAVEDHKRQENAIAMQAKLLADSSSTSPISPSGRENANGFTPSPISPPVANPPLPPMSNPALPLPGLADTTTFGNPQQSASFSSGAREERRHGPIIGRSRAGSASTESKGKEVLNDIAVQGKKGFNAILHRLGGDKGDREREENGFVVGSSGEGDGSGLQRRSTARGDPTRGMGTIKGVKVKREADEADKAYRLGVFHLESLRLRREKLHYSAVQNLETFTDDLNKALQVALERYMNIMHGTAATNAQATEVGRAAVDAINVDQDMMLYRTKLSAIDTYHTSPVPYHNFYVGQCRSLIFGVSLTDYDFARGEGSDHGRSPAIVEKCIAAVDERGLDAEGIYRISGRHAGVQKLVQDIELDEEKFAFEEKDDVFSISNVLKQYLRELPEPVFPLPHAERVKLTENREMHIQNNFSAIRARLRRLPPIHQTTFQAIIEHLGRVQHRKARNKMDAKNIAVVFNSVIFGQEQLPLDGNVMMMHLEKKDTVLEDLITYSDLLFGADTPPQVPIVLSPNAGTVSLQPGSSRTRVQITAPSPNSHGSPTRTPQTPVIRESPLRNTLPSLPFTNISLPSTNMSNAVDESHSRPFAPTFTPDAELDLLFNPSLIPSTMREAVGPEFHVRPLASTDLMRSHFGLLATLTVSPPVAPSVYSALFSHLKACPDTYYIVVIIHRSTDQMVAHGTVVDERKFIHGGSVAGHIEDIVVSPEVRGMGLGITLVKGLRDMATIGLGCYKVILDCKEDRVAFYEKCGFQERAKGMAYYRSTADVTPSRSPAYPASVPLPNLSSRTRGERLALPDVRQTVTRTDEIDVGSDHSSPKTAGSASSGIGVTYHFPPTMEGIDPSWAATDVPGGHGGKSASSASDSPRRMTSPRPMERASSPLPPGAAPSKMSGQVKAHAA